MKVENKQEILDALLPALNKTRFAADIVSLQYDAEKEMVTVTIDDGGKLHINVACDSGIAMIQDVVCHLI